MLVHTSTASSTSSGRTSTRPTSRLGSRLQARVHGGRLDRALGDGVDPGSSPALAARARLLASRSTRSQLADGVERLLESARRPLRRMRVPARSYVVLANAGTLQELAAQLRADTPLYVRGIAKLSSLLTDGTGPVYTSDDAESLSEELSEVRAALVGHEL